MRCHQLNGHDTKYLVQRKKRLTSKGKNKAFKDEDEKNASQFDSICDTVYKSFSERNIFLQGFRIFIY